MRPAMVLDFSGNIDFAVSPVRKSLGSVVGCLAEALEQTLHVYNPAL